MKTLGLDIGTTSISAVVYGPGNRVLTARTVKNASFLPGESWERIQNPQTIRTAAEGVVSQLLEAYPDIVAMGLTGQMHGIVYLDEEGNCVSPLYTWQDGRGDLPHSQGGTWADHLTRLTGYPMATGYGLTTHYYNAHNGLIPKTATTFCTIQDYLAMVFAGKSTPVTDPTDAASFGLYQPELGRFDREALAKLDLDEAMLPQVATQPYLGRGPWGIPVYTAIGDSQAAFLGAGGGRTDMLLVNIGTGSQICLYSPTRLETATLEARPFPDGGWLLTGASLCGGRSFAMLETFFRQTVQMVTGREETAYPGMMALLASMPQPEDLPLAQTTFQGTRRDPSLRGSFTQICQNNFTPLHLMYSVMHGMARELYQMYAGYLEKGGTAPQSILGSGNGLRRNPQLQKIIESTFSGHLELSQSTEEAACGAAIYCAKHFSEQ